MILTQRVCLVGFYATLTVINGCYGIGRANNVSRNVSTNLSNVTYPITGYFAFYLPKKDESCSSKHDPDSLLQIEAMNFAIETVNAGNMLPAVKLVSNIVDTCKPQSESISGINERFVELIVREKYISNFGRPCGKRMEGIEIAYGPNMDSRRSALLALPRLDFEVEIFADLFHKLNITAVNVIYSNKDNFWLQYAKLTQTVLSNNGICVTKAPLSDIDELYNDTIGSGRTVLILADHREVVNLLSLCPFKERLNGTVWFAGSTWGNSQSVLTHSNSPCISAAFTVGYRKTKFAGFYKHIERRLETSNDAQAKKIYRRFLRQNSARSDKVLSLVEPVRKAIFAYAQAIRHAVNKKCDTDSRNTTCASLALVDRSSRRSIVSFLKSGNRLNPNNDPSDYRVYQVDAVRNRYVTIGDWKTKSGSKDVRKGPGSPSQARINPRQSGTNTLQQSQYKVNGNVFNDVASFFIDGEGRGILDPSLCQPQCQPGSISVAMIGSKCCWSCKPCPTRHVTINNTCSQCPYGFVPSKDREHCYELQTRFLKIDDSGMIGLFIVGLIGLMLTWFVAGVFASHNQTKMVKSASRELSYFMLLGIGMCFAVPIVYLLRPSTLSCSIKRIYLGISFTTTYAALLLKTRRIERVFHASLRYEVNPWLTSTRAQICLCSGLVVVQFLFGLALNAIKPPSLVELISVNNDHTYYTCDKTPHYLFLDLSIPLCLIIICTYLGYKNRHLPKAYNDSKQICLTMYTSCLLWIIFLPMHSLITTANPYMSPYLVSGASQLVALVTLIGLFSYRVLLLLTVKTFVLDRNLRAFTGFNFKERADTACQTTSESCSQTTMLIGSSERDLSSCASIVCSECLKSFEDLNNITELEAHGRKPSELLTGVKEMFAYHDNPSFCYSEEELEHGKKLD